MTEQQQDLNAELQALIDNFDSADVQIFTAIDSGELSSVDAYWERNRIATQLAVFVRKHRAALRIESNAEPFHPPAWIAHVNSDAPRPDLDTG